jgi:hypothetical protein
MLGSSSELKLNSIDFLKIITSARPVEPVSTKAAFGVWAPRVGTVIFLNIPHMKFYLERWFPYVTEI